mmetsp:Transcript_89136/g.232440  ORF Transcript_89136/g.232440 Transcript_89136/m.232440 type:complete len:82 (-) Transcript_89136:51-296(-)
MGCEAPWKSIMANVLNSRLHTARCIFATFYDHEAKKVQGMCQDHGAPSTLLESPFYGGCPRTEVATQLRWAVVMCRSLPLQ